MGDDGQRAYSKLQSWIGGSFQKRDYTGVVNRISTMLFEIDNCVYSRQNTIGVRLEDLKNKPKQTIPALCKWMGIKECESTYEMTAQGKKWWGDPSSPDFERMDTTRLEKLPLNVKLDIFLVKMICLFFVPYFILLAYVLVIQKKMKRNLMLTYKKLDR